MDVREELAKRNLRRKERTSLEELCRRTKFNRCELRLLYRRFKQQCPEGTVHEDKFKEIYSSFFPNDSSCYAKCLFRTMDEEGHGEITFKELMFSLSTILRGSHRERLHWLFRMYDVSGDGVVSRSDLHTIVAAIYEIVGQSDSVAEDRLIDDHVNNVFGRLDTKRMGYIDREQFVTACLSDEIISECLANFCSNGIDYIC